MAEPLFSQNQGGCVTDGPFASYTLSIGPGPLVTDHCLTRAINNKFLQYSTSAQVANTTKQPTFELFRQEAGGSFKPPPWKVHDSGHAGINGEMASLFSSPGGKLDVAFFLWYADTAFIADPLFYLHHGNLNRVWWIWQNMDRANRLMDISGYTTINPPYRKSLLTLD